MIAFSIMMWFVSIIFVVLSISLLRGNYSSVHGKVLDSTEDKEEYAKALGRPVFFRSQFRCGGNNSCCITPEIFDTYLCCLYCDYIDDRWNMDQKNLE